MTLEADDEDGVGDRGENNHPVADIQSGRVTLMREKCATCIYRPGNKMHLSPGRVQQMAEDSIRREGHIVCHATLPGYASNRKLPYAICHGYWKMKRAQARSLALRMIRSFPGLARYLDPRTGEMHDTPAPEDR